MANNTVTIPYQYWADPTRGKPLSGGFAYIGEPNLDPEMHPIDVFYVVGGCDNCLVPAPNPVPIGAGGVILYNGFAVEIATNRNYSIRVLDSSGGQAYYEPSNEFSDNELVAIARSLNVAVSAVIYSTDTAAALDDVQYIYDMSNETIWSKPSGVQAGDVIISVVGDQLTTTSGSYTMITSGGGNTLVVSTGGTEPRTLSDRFSDVVNVKDFGARGNGVDDDTQSIQDAIDTLKAVYIPPGNYIVTRPLILNSQQAIFGAITSPAYGQRSLITIKQESWTGGIDTSIIKRSDYTQAQSMTINNIGFNGWADIDFSDLQNAEDIKINGVDVTAIKDGVDISGCSFRRLSTAVWGEGGSGYVGHFIADKVNVSRCIRAFDVNPTTGLTIMNSKIYDCYDWINAVEVTLINTSFNNSSFSTNNCGIHAQWINAKGCWFEGGNRWMDLNGLPYTNGGFTLENCELSEAFSDNGATKYMLGIKLNDSVYVKILNCKLPQNTRVFGNGLGDLGGVTLEVKGCENIGSIWSASTGDVVDLAQNGVHYIGAGNLSRSGYDDFKLNSELNLKNDLSLRWGASTAGLLIGEGPTVIDIRNIQLGSTQSTSRTTGFAKFVICGNLDGAGSTSAVYGEFIVTKGVSEGWRIGNISSQGNLSDQSLTLTGVAQIDLSSTSTEQCNMTINIISSGNRDSSTLFCSARSSSFFINA